MQINATLNRIRALYHDAAMGRERASAAIAFIAIHIIKCGFILGHPRDFLVDFALLLTLLPFILFTKYNIIMPAFSTNQPDNREQTQAGPRPKTDPFLILALVLALAFSMNGMGWGRFECWNGDQMALLGLEANGKPFTYAKPPLLTFMTHFLVLQPVSALERAMTSRTGQPHYYDEWKLLGARMLVDLMFLGTVSLAYRMTRVLLGAVRRARHRFVCRDERGHHCV